MLASVDPWALLLSAAAVIAMFRFKVGMIPTLAACSRAGVRPLSLRGRSHDCERRLRRLGGRRACDPAHGGRGQTTTFENTPPGSPEGLRYRPHRQGKPGRWEVVEDKTAAEGKALAQRDPDRTDYRFPLAIYMPTVQADVEVDDHSAGLGQG